MSNESPEVQACIKNLYGYINSLPVGQREKALEYQRGLELEMGTGDPERALAVIAWRVAECNARLVEAVQPIVEHIQEEVAGIETQMLFDRLGVK